MQTYSFHRILPSCTLNRTLLVEIEKRLLFGIPKLMQPLLQKIQQGLGLEGYKKLENYQVIVETKNGVTQLEVCQGVDQPLF